MPLIYRKKGFKRVIVRYYASEAVAPSNHIGGEGHIISAMIFINNVIVLPQTGK